MQQNVSNPERLASFAIGTVVLARSFFSQRAGFARLAQAAAGAALVWRGLSAHCPLYEKMGKQARQTSAGLPLNFEKSIRVHQTMEAVRRILGEDDPIWRNADNTILPLTAGDQVWNLRLKESHDGKETFIFASLANPESAKVQRGRIRSSLMKEALETELRRLKALLETGEIPTIEGQPSGRRSAVGRAVENLAMTVEESLRKNGTPPAAWEASL